MSFQIFSIEKKACLTIFQKLLLAYVPLSILQRVKEFIGNNKGGERRTTIQSNVISKAL